MIWLFKKIFCNHKFECIAKEIEVYSGWDDKIPKYRERVFVCEKCLKKKIIKY